MAVKDINAPKYRPLAEVRKEFRVKWYRCPIEHRVLRELSQRSNLQGFIQAVGHLGLFAITGMLAYFLWAQHIWAGFAFALFLHGTVGSFWVRVAGHELSHGSVFRTKQLNKFFLYLFSTLSWWDPFEYAASHTYHHRYTLHPEGDREVLLPLKPTVGKTFLLQLFTINVFTQRGRTLSRGGLPSSVAITLKTALGPAGSVVFPNNEWVSSLHTDQPDQFRRAMWWARWQLAFHSAVIVVAIFTGQWVLPFLLTIFPFIGNWAHYSVTLPQHCGLIDNVQDFRKSVRSMTLIPILEFLYWRMNWHCEHHMYAGVPCYNLKKLHRALAHDMPKPRTLIGAWKEMLATWDRQQDDPDYQYDTPLPPGASSVRSDQPHELESSIGDLAPREIR